MHRIYIDEGSTSRQEREVLRTLRTNIEFTGVENKVITITSVTPDDGKTTVAYSLASAFAENGQRTLLIDADLRRSILLRRLKVVDALKGLSHFLSGQESLNEVVYSTNVENLYLLPSGLFPTNPTELLANGRLEKMLQEIRGGNTFDYIIIDTPPLSNVIDAAVTAKVSDGSVLVIASDETSRTEAQSVVEQLKKANSNVLGVVLNKVDVGRGSYYGKYGSYGKYYGKYYGQNS